MISRNDTVRTFVEQLPNLAEIEPLPEEYWNRLGVWYERVVKERLRNPGLVRDRLDNLGLGFLQALRVWLDLPTETGTTAALREALTTRIIEDPTQTWCQDLFLLMELVENRDHEAIGTISRALLPKEVAQLIGEGVFIHRAQRLAYAMQMYYQNPADLALLVLFEKAERSSYTRYALVPQAEDGLQPIPEDEAEYAARRIQEGVDLSTLTVSEVDQALAKFEAGPRGGRHSACARILHEGDDSTLVFIRRVLREASIPEMDQTLFGDEAEIIVLKFGHSLRILEEHSAKGIGVSIAGAIASHLLQAKVEYLDDSTRTTREALDGFLTALHQDADERLRLVEIYLRQSPLEGSPILIVRCDKGASLAPTLDFLEGRQISLLEELDDVRYIGVAVDRIVGHKRRPYIFKLRFDPVAGSYFVRYSRSRLPRHFRSQFERWLRETYNVRAIPATR